jgi:preprotein translocase SecE subunit
MPFITFLKQTQTEMKHVTWINSKQVIGYTIAVTIISLLVAYMIGGFDFGLELGLTKLLVK